MRKKVVLIIVVLLILALLTTNNEMNKKGILHKTYASENTKFYGDYGIDGNYIKYIKDNTTVTYFAETSKLGENVKVKDKNNQERNGKDLVRTGDHIEIQDEKYTAVVAGDVDGNGVCNVIDFIAINGHRLGKNRLKDEYIIAGDVNYDGSVNILDMIKTNGYRLKKVDKLVPDIIQVEEIETDNKEIKITEGEEVSIHATAKPDNAQHKHLEYKSSDETIAEVDQNGRIKSKKAGKCVITIEAENGVSAICNVEIEKKKIPVQTIELSSEEIELKAGESELISATIKPQNATNKEIEWTSSNYEIATVDSKGEITGKQTGEATIIAKAKDGGEAEGQVKVKVYTKVEKIELSEKNITIEKGQSKKIEGKAIPENAINTKLYWSSENEEIADVNDNGEIRGKKVGETKIIVTTEDGIKEECTVKVEGQEDIQIKEIQINSNDIEINKNQEKQLAITISPSNATNKEIQWISKNEKIVEVDLSGMIRGKKAGETEIIARTTDGSNLESTIKVKVVVAVTALEVIPKNIAIKTEEEEQAYIVVTPTDASNKVVEWKSTNENIARISAEGKITGVGVGEAEIIAKTTDGSNIEGRATVKVEEEQKEILVSNIIANSNINLEKGERKTASLKILPDNATNKGITWESDNGEVATVDANGTVEGKGNGETTITVKAIDGSNVTATIKVKVVVPVEKIKINKDQITLDMSGAKETQIIGTIEPEDATDKAIEWESSNTSVVRVDETGKVTGIGNGSATITASSANGKTATCTINVVTSPTRISLNKTTSKLDLSGTKTVLLTSTIAPSNANINKEITWKSSNTAVATVDETGKVTGIANGTANITATLPNGTSATCTVTVVTSPTGISLSKNSVIFDMSNTKTTQLKATITPNSANANKGITWTSSNTNVVNVSTSGYLTAVGNGEATITASSANGKTATCTVKVQTSATSVTLNKATLTLDIGGTKNATLVGTIGPETADINKEITWTSGNTKIATVDETGKVTAIANGTANITATLPNGATATCTVKVQTSPTAITLNKTTATLDMSGTKTVTLKETINPNTVNANKTITWTSSNTKVATVTSSGKVTGVANGVTTITASTGNGKKSTCKITVQTSPTEIYFSANKNDTTKYETIQKGKTKIFKPEIKPNTANVNNSITYSLSGNSKIASIDSKTGKITAKQAGIVTLTAKSSNGKTAKMKIWVKIGNKAVNSTALTSISGDSIYSLAVPAYKAGSDFMHMQSFDIDSKGAIYYAGNNNKDGRSYKTHIYKATGKNARPTETGIEMIYSGHQSSIDVEEEGDTRYIWNMTFGSYIGKYGTAGNYAVSRIKYQNNKRIYWGPGTVTEKNSKKQVLNTYKNMAGDNFVYMNEQGQLRKSLCASVDEENGLLCIYYKNSSHVFFYIYDLNEALKLKNEKYTNLPIEPYKNVEKSAETTNEYIDFTAKNLGYKKQEDGTYVQNITPLATLKIENFLTDSMQGFDLDGDYIYVIEGLTKPTNITAFDYMYNYNGNKPLFKGTTVTASHTKSFYEKMGTSALLSYNNKNFYETEGIKVKNGVVYCGYAAKYDGETRASILQVK